MTRLLVLLVAMSACGGSGGASDAAGTLDLSAVADGAAVDLAEADLDDLAAQCANPLEHPADMAHGDLAWNMCAGTPLEGTCVATFFDSFSACFTPAGHCQLEPHNFGTDGDWQNGASYHSGLGPLVDGNLYWNATYQQGTTSCLGTYSAESGPDANVTHYCPGSDDCTNDHDLDAGTTMFTGDARYDRSSGVFTCPDGTNVTIGPDLGSCPALNKLLTPTWMCDFCTPP